MKSTSFCLNYASSVSFLNLFLREKIAWFCVTAFGSHCSCLCSCLSHPPFSTLPSWVSSFETFVQGRRKGSFITTDLINKALDLTGVSDRTKDVKRGSSGERRTESLLFFREAQDEHITNPNFSLFRCRRQAPVP